MNEDGAELATVARETFEYNIVPWAGRKYEAWVRSWARAHPRDPTGQVQVAQPIYGAFQKRTPGQRLTHDQAEALGYPRAPRGRTPGGGEDLARSR